MEKVNADYFIFRIWYDYNFNSALLRIVNMCVYENNVSVAWALLVEPQIENW